MITNTLQEMDNVSPLVTKEYSRFQTIRMSRETPYPNSKLQLINVLSLLPLKLISQPFNITLVVFFHKAVEQNLTMVLL